MICSFIVYAKWKPKADTSYKVVAWRQKADDNKNAAIGEKKYDYYDYDTVESAVSAEPITTLNSTAGEKYLYLDKSGSPYYDSTFANFDFSYIEVDGVRYYDRNAVIDVKPDPQGTTVVNVYYDRKLMTINYYTYSYYYSIWRLYKQFTGLYGSTLESNGYTWPTDYKWYDSYKNGSVSGTQTTFLDAFIFPDGGIIEDLYGTDVSGSAHIYFLKEQLDGTYVTANKITTGSGNFSITDK